MNNRPTERPQQTIPEIAFVILASPGVEEVDIIDASNGVNIVNAVINKAHGHGLTINVPHDNENYRKWEHLERDEWDEAFFGKRMLLHQRFDRNMPKDNLIHNMQSVTEQARRTIDKRDEDSLMPHTDQILRIRILCDEKQETCGSVVWNEHFKSSVWFHVVEQQPVL